jgi:anti-sigma factor RsiW
MVQRVSAERDELRELVERLSEDQVPAVLSEARRHIARAEPRPWPPAFFGAGRAGRGDVAERSEELLDDGFGRSA